MACACGCGEHSDFGSGEFVRGHWNRPSRSPKEYALWKVEREDRRAELAKVREAEKKYVRAKLDPVEARRRSLWSRYRLTPEVYETLLLAQGGTCAICGTDDPKSSGRKTFCIDHVHGDGKYDGSKTGDVRGLLCGKCNIGIGMLNHDQSVLEAAISYLKADPAIKR